MTALSANIYHLNKLAQPTEPYLNNYYEYRKILIVQFTKLFLQIMLAHLCVSKSKIRNDLYHISCIVFFANAARRRVMPSLTYTVGPSPLSRKRRIARMTTSRTWAVANLTLTGRGRLCTSARGPRRPSR